MSKFKLYASLRSPFARRVRIRLEELEVPFEVQMVNVFEPTAELIGLNPMGRVPVLLTPNGETIIDSNEMDQYLLMRHSTHSIYYCGGVREARARRWRGLAVGIMEYSVSAFLETLRPRALQADDVRQDFIDSIHRTLRTFEGEFVGPYLAGGELRCWDIDLGAALGYCDLRLGRGVADSYPKLREYLQLLHQRQSFRSSIPPA